MKNLANNVGLFCRLGVYYTMVYDLKKGAAKLWLIRRSNTYISQYTYIQVWNIWIILMYWQNTFYQYLDFYSQWSSQQRPYSYIRQFEWNAVICEFNSSLLYSVKWALWQTMYQQWKLGCANITTCEDVNISWCVTDL